MKNLLLCIFILLKAQNVHSADKVCDFTLEKIDKTAIDVELIQKSTEYLFNKNSVSSIPLVLRVFESSSDAEPDTWQDFYVSTNSEMTMLPVNGFFRLDSCENNIFRISSVEFLKAPESQQPQTFFEVIGTGTQQMSLEVRKTVKFKLKFSVTIVGQPPNHSPQLKLIKTSLLN
jgi:hypothetical protein